MMGLFTTPVVGLVFSMSFYPWISAIRMRSTSSTSDGLVADECSVSGEDISLLGVRQTDATPQGLLLPSTTAYVSSCKECSSHNLQCAGQNVPIEEGQCLCAWRNEKHPAPRLRQMACGNCVSQCLGNYQIFDSEKLYTADYIPGICLRKKDVEPVF
ncbi:unnamed protein product [Amoebophrya sp. A25]|nr:unnamed protein product [Amoebophrya sp. A25]|eukprot:GSA25T00024233001.1